jgi:mono/diheme cytochrome c family protein
MRSTLLIAFSLFLLLGLQPSRGAGQSQRTQVRSADTAALDHGRYLVEEVAKCTECHTPRDADNQLDRSRWLQGAPIWIQSVRLTPNWAQFAPSLAGLPGLSDEQMQRVLEQGLGADGHQIQPPMHVYHLVHGDAQAIIAYLRSLPTPVAH